MHQEVLSLLVVMIGFILLHLQELLLFQECILALLITKFHIWLLLEVEEQEVSKQVVVELGVVEQEGRRCSPPDMNSSPPN